MILRNGKRMMSALRKECAEEGDALCQYLHGWHVHHDPKLSNPQQHQQRYKWMSAAGHQGFGEESRDISVAGDG